MSGTFFRYSKIFKSPIPVIRRKFDEDDVAAIMSIHSASSTGDGKQSSEDEDYTQDRSIVRLVWGNKGSVSRFLVC